MNEIDDFGENISYEVRRLQPSGDQSTAVRSEKQKRSTNLCQWENAYENAYWAVSSTLKNLEAGAYSLTYREGKPIFVNEMIKVDDLLNFPDTVNDQVLKEIDFFWKRKQIFKSFGFLHRRGYLFYGPPGSGKSCVVQQIIAKIINNNGIVIYCNTDPDLITNALRNLREIEPDRQIICLYEDIDALIECWGESTILSLLDGESNIDNVLNIATSNYPEKLDKRIISRPRRFDRLIKVELPSKLVRKIYFKEKLKIEDTELKKWIDASENFSFAAMTELVISVKCLNKDFDETVNVLKNLMTKKISSEDFEDKDFGFKNE